MKVKFCCIAGCLLTASVGGLILRTAPLNDPAIWLCAGLLGCSFACFWAELNRPD